MKLNICGEYPPDWPDISKRVKDDAEWRCVRCRKSDTGNVYADIRAERARQDAQHGGPEHDDTHTADEWLEFRAEYEQRVLDLLASPIEFIYEPADGRIALVKIAALVVAQIEALDRKQRGGS